ncbi:GNAT family N-acetyltransferase [Streptomyces sp. ME19-01-6]|nr:GNAT family N-acetyltransferase [Streptomyces sp. ME19-01-6]
MPDNADGEMAAPSMAGVSFRPYRGEADHPALLRVRLGCRNEGGVHADSVVEPMPTAEGIADFATAPEDPSRDQIIVEHGGTVVGHAHIISWTDGDGTVVYLHRGRLLPERRGQGIGTAMVRWAEGRIARLVAEHGTADRACFAANAADVEADAVDLLEELGYACVFRVVEFELADLRHLPDLPGTLPDGTELRPVEEAHYRPIWEMIREAYADTGNVGGWDFSGFVNGAEPAHWQVAWDGSGVAGAALCVAGPRGNSVGEVRELSVRKDRRRKGLARALLLAGLHALARQGEHSARLFTGAANPYRSYELYESVGFRRVATFGRYRKPFTSRESDVKSTTGAGRTASVDWRDT